MLLRRSIAMLTAYQAKRLLMQGIQGLGMMRRGLMGKAMTRRTWSGRRRSC